MGETVGQLVQEFHAGKMRRQEFIRQAAFLTGSLAVATSLIDSLFSTAGYAAQVDPNDPALTSSDVKFAAEDGAAIVGFDQAKIEQLLGL
jgi:hypothetical protein